VHRVDAELALSASRRARAEGAEGAEGAAPVGRPPSVRPRFGADGIDELLTGFYARRHRGLVSPEPVALTVRCVATDAGWTIRIGPDARQVSRQADTDTDTDCTIRGTASDLYLFLWNRRDAGGIEVVGDSSVLALWRDRARIT
jgi:hypothetical protein